MSDTISRQAVIDLVEELETQRLKGDIGLLYAPMIKGVRALPSVQSEPAIPLSWIEGQIEWLKSLDNEFSTLTAGQILAMMNKWKDEQDG